MRCSIAAQREVNAAKQERANADTAAVLAEEKRKARDAITQAHEAMQEAKRLQAEANAKYAAAEAVLEKFDSPTYHPSRRRPKRARRPLQRASSGYERIPIERES